MPGSRLVLRAFATALLVSAATAASASPEQPTAATVVPQSTGPGGHRLVAVDDLGPGDVWTAGYREPDFLPFGLARQETGSGWRQHTPRLTGAFSSLAGLASFGPDDVWVVGRNDTSNYSGIWDGRSWQSIPVPEAGVDDGLAGVSGVAPDDVWAVGFAKLSGTQGLVTVADHWDGHVWTQVPTPNQGPQSQLVAVDAISSDDVWAIGRGDEPRGPFFAHWDGSSWSIVPQPLAAGHLVSVLGFAANDVWAVGEQDVGDPPSEMKPVLEHWDGATWTLQHPAGVGGFAQLNGLGGTSSSDMWAVGCTLRMGAEARRTIIEHYDGIAWTRVTSPNPQVHETQCLSAVSASSPTDAWAVGTYGYNIGTGGLAHNLYVQWNGRRWIWDKDPRGRTSP